jgi:hypothetical protein
MLIYIIRIYFRKTKKEKKNQIFCKNTDNNTLKINIVTYKKEAFTSEEKKIVIKLVIKMSSKHFKNILYLLEVL